MATWRILTEGQRSGPLSLEPQLLSHREGDANASSATATADRTCLIERNIKKPMEFDSLT